MIKKFIIALFLISTYLLNAQDQQQNTDVELPDFVITGKDVVTIRNVQKIPPDFVSTISEEFLKPVFPTENLPVKEVNTPIKGAVSLDDSLNYINGSIEALLGSYYLPKASLNFSSPFRNGLFEGYANAENRRAYVDNSERYSLNGGASLALFVNDDAGFLPGTKFKFNGDYGTSNYKFFASPTPLLKRTLNNGDASVKIENLMSKYFIYSGKLSDEISLLGNENFTENMFNIDGYAKLSLAAFNLRANLNYKKQTITNDLNSHSRFSYIAVRPAMGLDFSKLMKINFGFNYSHEGSNNFFSPYAALSVKLNQAFTFYGEFSPQTDFFGGGHFLKSNPYFMPQKFTNLFYKKNINFNASVKYEYFTYVEIDGGIKYYSSDNLPFFIDTSDVGKFNLGTTNGKSVTAFVNLLFHPGPNGVFYATAEVNDTRDAANNIIPYYPRAKVTMNYNYDFKNGLNAGANLIYFTGMYSDILNQNSLNSYINLGVNFDYKLNQNFFLTLKFSNLLNHDNYIWHSYKELPLDLQAGLNYRW
ncbi:MAG: hypothetical protein M1480_19810 [Bacteroidetes bacterium]|nr:hypothetical protein [Bacteroidota bacterium]